MLLRAIVFALCSLATVLGCANCAGRGRGSPADAADTASSGDAVDVAQSDARDAEAGVTVCPDPPACDAPPPPLGATSSWNHPVATGIVVAQGSERHRGRDLFLRVGDPQWVLAKFAYGALDDDLKDEDVDLYLLRDCGAMWETLGTARTTNDGAMSTVEGVVDTGGRVYFPIPATATLGVGLHRVLLVVRGDHTMASQYIRVLPADARVVVSDVDGTLTDSENAQFTALFTGTSPGANPGAAAALGSLTRRGYFVWYLTARPEWLGTRTHEWLAQRGFPLGIVHTTLTFTGATSAPAQTFKTDELAMFLARFGRVPEYGFGNTVTDVGAYADSGINPMHAYYYLFTGDTRGGNSLADYRTLVSGFDALPAICR